MRSPTPGRSILMTSAPMSPRIEVQNGPDSTCSKATTLTPWRAGALFAILDLGKQVVPWSVRLFPNHYAARVVDHDLAFLLHAARAHLDDAPFGLRLRLALVHDLRFRVEGVAGEKRVGQLDLVPAERETVLADVGDAHPGDDCERERAIDET